MKLFGDFEAVRFPEENLIFITHGGYLYYIYDAEYKRWRKYRNAGNDHITVRNYDDVSKEELKNALDGKYPQKETDFMRFCNPAQLRIRDMLPVVQSQIMKTGTTSSMPSMMQLIPRGKSPSVTQILTWQSNAILQMMENLTR